MDEIFHKKKKKKVAPEILQRCEQVLHCCHMSKTQCPCRGIGTKTILWCHMWGGDKISTFDC